MGFMAAVTWKYGVWNKLNGDLYHYNWTQIHVELPYLPVYNARLCIIRTLIFDLFFPKKKIFIRRGGSGKAAR